MKSKNLFVASFNPESVMILKVSALLKVWMEKEDCTNARDVFSIILVPLTLLCLYVICSVDGRSMAQMGGKHLWW